MAAIEEKGNVPLLPDPGPAVYLLAYWYDVGMVQSSGMAPIRLTSTELRNWSDATHTELTSWEFNTLRAMSVAYLSQAHVSEAADSIPPFGAVVTAVTREQVSKNLGGFFARLSKAKHK